MIEEWVAAHPDALDADELEHQRRVKWRPFQRWSSLVRAPADGAWGTKAPSALRAAPRPRGAPKGDKALDEVVLRHLRAFGPAGAEDVAGWIGWRTPPVRAAIERLAPDLARFEDEEGRAALRPARRAAAGPRDARPSPPAGRLRQRPAGLRQQAPQRASCPTRIATRSTSGATCRSAPATSSTGSWRGRGRPRSSGARRPSRCARWSAWRARRAPHSSTRPSASCATCSRRPRPTRSWSRAERVKHRPAKGVEPARAADRIPRAPRRRVRGPGAPGRAQADARHRQPVRDDGLRSPEEPRHLCAAGPLRGRRDGHRGARPRDRPLSRGRPGGLRRGRRLRRRRHRQRGGQRPGPLPHPADLPARRRDQRLLQDARRPRRHRRRHRAPPAPRRRVGAAAAGPRTRQRPRLHLLGGLRARRLGRAPGRRPSAPEGAPEAVVLRLRRGQHLRQGVRRAPAAAGGARRRRGPARRHRARAERRPLHLLRRPGPSTWPRAWRSTTAPSAA